jgi:two-component system phosphate regulon response regulator PhoB
MSGPKKILVVEDEPDLQEILKHVLEASGYCVQCAGNGKEGLRLYNEFAPDLVMLDVHLPDMSGFEVCRKMRADAIRPKTPIIICSVRSEVAPVAEGLDSGANDYILKPFEVPELLERVQSALSARKNR